MEANEQKRLSHAMSRVLRHRAREAGLVMDAAGWVAIDALCQKLGVTPDEVAVVVTHNNKARFEVAGERIRASQGHSLDSMPVTQEALEASWSGWPGTDALWHGTRVEAIASIAEQGLLCGGRSHVHLAESRDSRVGKRSEVAVLLEIAPDRLRGAGYPIYRSPNGVILARHVPASCIVGLVAVTRRAKEQVASLRAALRL